MAANPVLYLTWAQHKAMLEDVLRNLPAEACGLLAGTGERVQSVYVIDNELTSPVAFRMDPHQQLRAFKAIEAAGLDLLAIYHSHPRGPSGLSQVDLASDYYPGVAWIVWSPDGREWRADGYRIEDGMAVPVNLAFGDEG